MDEPVAIQGEPSDPDRNASCTIGGGLSTHVLRLVPGSEILSSLQDYVRANNLKAAFVMTAVGSVTKATLRFAHDPATGNEVGCPSKSPFWCRFVYLQVVVFSTRRFGL